jgi:hypothetical protein
MKFRDLSKSAYEFRDNFYDFSSTIEFKHNLIDVLFKNPLLFFQLFLAVQVISALLATLGSKFFSFVTGLLLTVNGLITQNPIKLYHSVRDSEAPGPNLFFPPLEMILTTSLILAIFTHAFRSGCHSVVPCELKEPVVSEAGKHVNVEREPKSASVKGKKKRII